MVEKQIENPHLIGTSEARKLLGASGHTIRSLVNAGILTAYRPGPGKRNIRVEKVELATYLADLADDNDN